MLRLSRKTFRASTILALSLSLPATVAFAEMPAVELNGNAEAGKEVAMDRAKGNCIACHMIPGGDSPGAIGPALIAMQTRYPSKEAVARQIWDPMVKNPEAVMPPFGKHGILTNQEFVDVVEYVWSL
jgi:sulfur-oxidizing protein SoxX